MLVLLAAISVSLDVIASGWLSIQNISCYVSIVRAYVGSISY